MDEHFDIMFLPVSKQHQGAFEMLDSVLGFLARRTDFFAAPYEEIKKSVLEKKKKKSSDCSWLGGEEGSVPD